MAAEVLCFEPDGKVVLEDAGHPCQDAAAEKAFGKPCIDLKVDNQESHAVAPANPVPHADLQPLAFIPVLFYRLEAPQEPSLVQPLATGPPISISPAAIRRTTVLLI